MTKAPTWQRRTIGVVVLGMTSPTLTGSDTHVLALPAVLHGGRRRITRISAQLLAALAPHIRAGGDAEHSAALASLLVTDVDAEDQGAAEPHLTGGAPIDCAVVPALGVGVRLRLLADGGFLVALADEAPPAPQPLSSLQGASTPPAARTRSGAATP